jgi:hypothetical protein
MPRTCSICSHADRLDVEATLRARTPLRTIGARWSVSKTALLRHRERHGHARGHADGTRPAIATPVAAPHTLAVCAAAILARCIPEVRKRYEDAAASMEWSLDDFVATALHEFVRHLDQCPRSTTGPES